MVAVRTLELRDASMLEQLRDASVRDLRAFITERGFSYAGLERHELEARAPNLERSRARSPTSRTSTLRR